jgi:membrane associated rhomboid family serine protease
MNNFRGTGFGQMPPVIKNLLILNIIVFLLTQIGLAAGMFNLYDHLALYYPGSEKFKPYQLVTHLFMHGDFWHIALNMFMLWMFGRVMEQVWGGNRFFIYYVVTGLGAALLHTFVNYLEINSIINAANSFVANPTPDNFAAFINDKFPEYYNQVYKQMLRMWYNEPGNVLYVQQAEQFTNELLQLKMSIPTVGASGAVFGVLLAFGMTFPNVELFLIFMPFIPIKAKYMVIGMGLLELMYGFGQAQSNIAHFAHLGGMIFGFILIKYWKKTTKMY